MEEFPKWVPAAESHILRSPGKAPIVPLFPNFHVARDGVVSVLVTNAEEEAAVVAPAAVPQPAPAPVAETVHAPLAAHVASPSAGDAIRSSLGIAPEQSVSAAPIAQDNTLAELREIIEHSKDKPLDLVAELQKQFAPAPVVAEPPKKD
jgi:hypothetical protein